MLAIYQRSIDKANKSFALIPTMDPKHMVIPAPKLDRWLHDRRISNTQAAAQLGISREAIRLYRLPFGDVGRRVPRDDVLERIVTWTGGEVTAADFYPDHLNGRTAATPEAEAAR